MSRATSLFQSAAPTNEPPRVIRLRSRVEYLAEQLVARTRISCASMPAKWSGRQIEVLRIIFVHGRDPGGMGALAARLGVSPQGLASLLEPLHEDGLIEKFQHQKEEGAGRGRTRVGLIVTKRGAEVLARVENAELGIEACVLQRLTPKERAELISLLEKAINDNEEPA